MCFEWMNEWICLLRNKPLSLCSRTYFVIIFPFRSCLIIISWAINALIHWRLSRRPIQPHLLTQTWERAGSSCCTAAWGLAITWRSHPAAQWGGSTSQPNTVSSAYWFKFHMYLPGTSNMTTYVRTYCRFTPKAVKAEPTATPTAVRDITIQLHLSYLSNLKMLSTM